MLIEIGLIAAGIPIGWAMRKKEKIKTIVDKSCTYAVYALVFFLGIKIGNDKVTMSSLDVIGVQALIFSIAICFGSILSGVFIHKRLKGL